MTKSARGPYRSLFVALVGGGLMAAATGAPAGQPVEVTPVPEERRVEVRVGGEPFTAYVWLERLAKPLLYPLRTARGTLITRGFPLDPRPGERVDHPHHVGLWLNYGDVNGVDFWNNSEALPPERAAEMGTIRHEAIRAASGGDPGTLEVEADWVMPDGSTAVEESTTYRFGGTVDTRRVDRITTLKAGPEKVTFADNKEGVLGLRVARALEAPSDEPEIFTDATGRPTTVAALDNEGVNGVYHSSEGLEGGDVWGTRARWVALAGRVEEEDVVVLILDHPANPGHPTYWHARGYGLFAANPLGQKVFSEGREELGFALAPGESTVFRHRVLLLPGPFSARAAEAAWTAFVAEHPE